LWGCVSFLVLAGNRFWCYVCTKCTIQLCVCVIFLVVAGNCSLNKPIGALPGRDYVLTRMVLQIILYSTLASRGLEEPAHALRGLEEPFFQLCCCVSFLFWREIPKHSFTPLSFVVAGKLI
jgi:hypothetical protein